MGMFWVATYTVDMELTRDGTCLLVSEEKFGGAEQSEGKLPIEVVVSHAHVRRHRARQANQM